MLLPQRAAPASLAGCCPCEWRRPPLRAGPGRSWLPPCRGPWPRPSHGWPALHAGWPPLHFAAFAAKMEIVYPCIPDPDGEDEGGQASSSLAVSTRWIFAAKLLQSDLATLAQRERGQYEVVAKATAYQS
ncbi:hypothetical protein BHM03_00032666 [Ensete ventricosum]|nr:hypothetical protein BHM03_00032666 [Ensete ventricosum]